LPAKESVFNEGFTLIEMSIVLVIIGLIVGGILVGRNLIDAAAVRAQVTQIEKYQTAANTFRGKYGYLPGDINATAAQQFGFAARGPYAGQGDGNGVIQGNPSNSAADNSGVGTPGTYEFTGEQAMFWVDLSQAGLIDGIFNTATSTATASGVSAISAVVGQYFPQAKIGSGGYVYVWSGGWSTSDNMNYFAVSTVYGKTSGADVNDYPLMTVVQAYAIDAKADDGFPQSGHILAMMGGTEVWASGGLIGTHALGSMIPGDYDGATGGPITSSTANPQYVLGGAYAKSCYNNGDTTPPQPEQYSMGVNNGAGVNCALSFQFQ
jgi:prepilin-type N-terminal cleavage/methylation domain-containing protein